MSEAPLYPEESRVSFETSIEAPADVLSERKQRETELLDDIRTAIATQETLKQGIGPQDEVKLAAVIEWRQGAEEALLELYGGYIHTVARAYHGTGLTRDDFLQQCKIGFLIAARKFDPSEHGEFSSYAASLMKREVLNTIAQTSRVIRLPDSIFWKVPKIPVIEEGFKQDKGRLPTDAELAEVLNETSDRIADLRSMARDAAVILDEPLSDEGTSMTRGERIADNSIAIGVVENSAITDPRLRAAFHKLRPAHQAALARKFGLDTDIDELPEDKYGEIEKRARKNLRAIMDSGMEGVFDSDGSGETEAQDWVEKREYDPFASPLLDVRDGPWLTVLMKRPPSTEFFQRANELIINGSDDLTGRYQRLGGSDLDDVVAANLAARRQFFTDIGFTNPQHPLHASFEAEVAQPKRQSLPKLSNFVLTQRALFLHGVHPAQMIKANPNALFYSPDFVVSHLQTLENLGLDVGKVMKSQPGVLRLSSERLHTTASTLIDEGLDVKRTLETDPWLFMTAPSEITERVANLRNQGFDAQKIILRCPSVLNCNTETFNQKLADWQTMGLEPAQILPRAPELVSFNTDTLRKKLAAFKQLSSDIDWDTLFQRQPKLLQSNVDKVGRRIQLLQRLGRTLEWEGDVNELILEKPAILADAQSKLLFLARVAAEKLDQDARQLTAKQIKDATIIPVDSHLFATSRTIEPYSPNLARRYSTGKTPDERRGMAERALRDPASVKQIGDKIIRAYNRHVAPKPA